MWHPDLGDGVHPDKWASIDCPLPRIRSRMCWIGYVFTPVEIAAMMSLQCRLGLGASAFSAVSSTRSAPRPVGRIAAFASWWTLGGTVILVVTLLVKAPVRNDAHFVFLDYENFTG